MRLLTKNFKEFIKLIPENYDDLLLIQENLNKQDIVKGIAYRKINLAGKEDKAKTIKKKYFLTIEVEKTELKDNLKIIGKIRNAPKDLPEGAVQSINIDLEDELRILKEWQDYEINFLKEATKKKRKILIVAFDSEEANFAKISGNMRKIILKLKGSGNKKQFKIEKSNFFKEINNSINEINKQETFDSIILASPNFWKKNMQEALNTELTKKIIFATISTGKPAGIDETLKRPELKKAMETVNCAEEQILFEELMKKISKDEAVYGINDIKKAIEYGAAETVIISKSLIKERKLIQKAEAAKCKIKIFSSEVKEKLDNLGGIAATLRFKI
jgi:protein pelota